MASDSSRNAINFASRVFKWTKNRWSWFRRGIHPTIPSRCSILLRHTGRRLSYRVLSHYRSVVPDSGRSLCFRSMSYCRGLRFWGRRDGRRSYLDNRWRSRHSTSFSGCFGKAVGNVNATDAMITNTTSIIYPDIRDALSLPFLARYVM
jgi:hypothetical protein